MKTNEPLSLITATQDFSETFQFYRQRCSHRNDGFFLKFLPKGYRATTLDSVSDGLTEQVILAKLHLGMLITLHDDFADHSKRQNGRLLEELYKVPYATDTIHTDGFSEYEKGVVELAVYLGEKLLYIISSFPNHSLFAKFFQYDLWQFYQCNRYSQLVTANPGAVNLMELSSMGSHNMGMIAAGMIDLMASRVVQQKELGGIRTVLTFGQRFGRICNILTTYHRELAENGRTNELIVMVQENIKSIGPRRLSKHPYIDRELSYLECRSQLEEERDRLFAELEVWAPYIQTFDVDLYLEGLQELENLHEEMSAKI